MSEQLEEKALEIIEKIEGLAPAATDAALAAISMGGIVSVFSGVLCMACAALSLYAVFWLIKNGGRDPSNNLEFGPAMFVVVFVCIGFICAIPAMLNVLYLWNWVAIFNPELFLANQMLEKVL